eukprot:1764717-Amphidinium_carterae.1
MSQANLLLSGQMDPHEREVDLPVNKVTAGQTYRTRPRSRHSVDGLVNSGPRKRVVTFSLNYASSAGPWATGSFQSQDHQNLVQCWVSAKWGKRLQVSTNHSKELAPLQTTYHSRTVKFIAFAMWFEENLNNRTEPPHQMTPFDSRPEEIILGFITITITVHI